MSDLIKREDAKETIDTMICDNKWVCECAINSLPSEDVVRIEVYRELYEKYVELKHELEQSQKDNWIPVSERLPDIKEHHVSDPCLVYCENGAYGFAELEENIFGQVGWNCEREDEYHEPIGDVLAWKPLPTPYKESEVQNESRRNTLP